jgi:hypothetical protein
MIAQENLYVVPRPTSEVAYIELERGQGGHRVELHDNALAEAASDHLSELLDERTDDPGGIFEGSNRCEQLAEHLGVMVVSDYGFPALIIDTKAAVQSEEDAEATQAKIEAFAQNSAPTVVLLQCHELEDVRGPQRERMYKIHLALANVANGRSARAPMFISEIIPIPEASIEAPGATRKPMALAA